MLSFNINYRRMTIVSSWGYNKSPLLQQNPSRTWNKIDTDLAKNYSISFIHQLSLGCIYYYSGCKQYGINPIVIYNLYITLE